MSYLAYKTNIRDAANHAYQAIRSIFQTVDFNEAYGGPLELGVGMHVGRAFVGEFELDQLPICL